MEINGYFLLIAATVIGVYLLGVVSHLLNLKALQPELPEEFHGLIGGRHYARSQAYTRETTRFGLLQSTFWVLLFLVFWWLGGFQWLDGLVRELGFQPEVRAKCFVVILFLAHQILSLPFGLYGTFVVEEKYGFNKTTPATFVADFIKRLLLRTVAIILALNFVLDLFQDGAFGYAAWLAAWVTIALGQIFVFFIFPKWILRLFHKLEPLKEGELRSGIEAVAKKCDFPLTGVFEVDSSRRSTKSNAFFAGFGKNKKIVFFDTLIKKHPVPQLVALFAHEIGHSKLRHIPQMLILSVCQVGIFIGLFGACLNNRGLFDAFGVRETSVYLSLVFFFILLCFLWRLLGVGLAILRRKNEFEADAFAAKVTGDATALIAALKTLAKDNLLNLTPHPFHVLVNSSHPPVIERIAALRAL